MTTISDRDEARLRARVRTIAEAIGDCHDEGRADLLAPRRSHRYGVTVAVAAAAVLVLIAVAVLVSRGGDATTTRVADGSGVLDGLEVSAPPATNFVSTERGLVAVTNTDGDHTWQPTVYAPDDEGVYRWYVNESVSDLMPGPAWVDGDTIRTVGHDCPADERTSDEDWCDARPLVATAFSLDTMTWSDAVTIDTHGLVLATHEAAGNAQTLIVPISVDDGPPTARQKTGLDSGSHLVRVDVERGTVTRLGSDPIAAPRICASAGTFLVGSGNTSAVTDSDGSNESPPKPSIIGVVEGDAIAFVPVGVATDTGFDGLVSSNGCAMDGMVVTTFGYRDRDNRPLIVRADREGTSASTLRPDALPTDWSADGAVAYTDDVTGTALVAIGKRPGESSSNKSWDLAVWDEASARWRRLDDAMQPASMVAVDRQGRAFVVDPIQNGSMWTVRLRGPVRLDGS